MVYLSCFLADVTKGEIAWVACDVPRNIEIQFHSWRLYRSDGSIVDGIENQPRCVLFYEETSHNIAL